jgi:DNA-directed RNA polymerase III subunit RPC2
MGVETDQEIMQLVGSEDMFVDGLAASFEECAKYHIYTQLQALDWIGGKIKVFQKRQWRRPRIDEARDILASVVLGHVPVQDDDFKPKCVYVAIMIRRILIAMKDPSYLDDKDYYGNKRLELYDVVVFATLLDDYNHFSHVILYARAHSFYCSTLQCWSIDVSSLRRSLQKIQCGTVSHC